MAGETRRLGEYISAIRFQDLPSEVVHQAKRFVLDHLGIAVAGGKSAAGRSVVETVKLLGGTQESTIIGEPVLGPSVHAALANGTMGYSQMLDDLYLGRGWVHAGNAVIPAALAMGESRHLSGADFIAAIVAGYEVVCRAADAVGKSHNDLGFYVGSTNPNFGAAAAAARALGVDAERCCHALGLAGSMVSGVREEGLIHNDSQPFHAGKAASNGVLAALLASNGLSAGETVFEGKEGRMGYLDVFSHDSDPNQLVDGLGTKYRLEGVGFKFHPVAGGISPSIDAMVTLVEKHEITPKYVEKITVKTHWLELSHHDNPAPDTRSAAMQSNHYCVARALTDGRVLPRDLEPERLKEAEVREVMGKVSLELDPEHEAAFPALISATVVVQTRDGKIHQETVKSAKGMASNPATDQELEKKFYDLISTAVPRSRAEEIRSAVWSLETLPDIGQLAALLRP